MHRKPPKPPVSMLLLITSQWPEQEWLFFWRLRQAAFTQHWNWGTRGVQLSSLEFKLVGCFLKNLQSLPNQMKPISSGWPRRWYGRARSKRNFLHHHQPKKHRTLPRNLLVCTKSSSLQLNSFTFGFVLPFWSWIANNWNHCHIANKPCSWKMPKAAKKPKKKTKPKGKKHAAQTTTPPHKGTQENNARGESARDQQWPTRQQRRPGHKRKRKEDGQGKGPGKQPPTRRKAKKTVHGTKNLIFVNLRKKTTRAHQLELVINQTSDISFA